MTFSVYNKTVREANKLYIRASKNLQFSNESLIFINDTSNFLGYVVSCNRQ